MTPIRLAAVVAIMLFMLSACGQDDSQTGTSGSDNSLLAYVPNGTPYLGGNLEPTPDTVVDGFLAKMEPVMATVQVELVKVRAEIEANPESAGGHSKLILALLQEFDGKLNRSGLESLGFDLQAYQVYYGVGPYPVARMTLKDAAVFKATVQRVLDNAGISAPQLDFEGQAYWKIPAGDHDDDYSDWPVSLLIAILPDHMAVGVMPESLEAEMLPAFLGKQIPENTDAAERLAALNGQYDYTPYFTGVLDLNLLADEFLNPGTVLARSLDAGHAAELAAISPQCKTEFRQIIANSPRWVMGSTALTDDTIGLQYLFETPPSLAQELMALLADIPMADALSTRVLEFAFGIKVGATRDFLREKITSITEVPYQCEHLQEMNDYAVQGLAQLQQPIPPFVNNFRGLRLSLSSIIMGGSIPYSGAGLLAVYVDQPEMFVGMAQMFLPDLSAISLVKGDPPVPLPASMIPVPDVVAFAALSDNAIGVSVGAGEEGGLLPFLDEKANDKGVLLSVNYDAAAYMDFNDSMSSAFEAAKAVEDLDDDAADAVIREQEQKALEIAEAVQNSYREVVDRSMLDVRFIEEGVAIDSTMTFK